ncbi:uncharacterized protein RAG0_01122 [Rhynchosporium agropyri]|uniref:Uncharacterized protein n=1 Tax=Rhynchosporium agropyri TaxID=914238 RepID=A0A1E1JVP1_9HELO|nr:uncharacterized protein RAG0_01122 [Rhynchosporium agropyri]
MITAPNQGNARIDEQYSNSMVAFDTQIMTSPETLSFLFIKKVARPGRSQSQSPVHTGYRNTTNIS